MNNNYRQGPLGPRSSLFILVLACLAMSCDGGGLFGPSNSVDGTWNGTFIFSTVTASVTATLAETSAEEDTVTGSFTATRSSAEAGSVDETDGGSVEGVVGSGIGLPTVALTFVSAKYCDWTVTAVLDDETMTGTWSTTTDCAVPSSGAITLTRS